MTPIAQAAINTLLQRGSSPNDSPQTFATVANVSSINGFNLSAAMQDVTSHSTGVPWRQKIPTLLDAGDLTADVFFVPGSDGHRQLLDDYANRRTLDWRVVFPDVDQTTLQCEGFISKFSLKAPVDGVVTASCTWTLTGMPSLPTDGGSYS